MNYVALDFPPGAPGVFLDEPTGKDEISLSGVDSASAVAFLERVVHWPTQSPRIREMAIADRDRVLAALHRLLYGDTICIPVECVRCKAEFELTFSLDELLKSLESSRRRDFIRIDGEIFELATGGRFRLPTARDEAQITGLCSAAAEQVLVARCVVEGDLDAAALSEALSKVAPSVDVELQGKCVECGSETVVRFDIQSFCLEALLREQPAILDDVDCLARVYGWSLTEILSLKRSHRRSLVALASRQSRRGRR